LVTVDGNDEKIILNQCRCAVPATRDGTRFRYYDCGKAFVKIQTGKGTAPSGRRVFPTTWVIQEHWERQDAKHLPPIGSLNLRCIQDPGEWSDKCWLNGKFCRKMSDEEGQKEFPDED
jgi:hypothetical protein